MRFRLAVVWSFCPGVVHAQMVPYPAAPARPARRRRAPHPGQPVDEARPSRPGGPSAEYTRMASRYAGSGPGDERGKMKIAHVNPDAMSKDPAVSQAVIVADAKKLVFIGEQNGVDAHGVVVGDDLESQTEQA